MSLKMIRLCQPSTLIQNVVVNVRETNSIKTWNHVDWWIMIKFSQIKMVFFFQCQDIHIFTRTQTETNNESLEVSWFTTTKRHYLDKFQRKHRETPLPRLILLQVWELLACAWYEWVSVWIKNDSDILCFVLEQSLSHASDLSWFSSWRNILHFFLQQNAI